MTLIDDGHTSSLKERVRNKKTFVLVREYIGLFISVPYHGAGAVWSWKAFEWLPINLRRPEANDQVSRCAGSSYEPPRRKKELTFFSSLFEWWEKTSFFFFLFFRAPLDFSPLYHTDFFPPIFHPSPRSFFISLNYIRWLSFGGSGLDTRAWTTGAHGQHENRGNVEFTKIRIGGQGRRQTSSKIAT